MNYFYKMMPSPVGELTLVATEQGLAAVLWENDKPSRVPLNELRLNQRLPLLLNVEQQLNDYFAQKLKQFTLPLDISGTEFQKKVWHALMTIPFGEKRSYAHIAKQIGHEKAVRAVGAANGKNPVSIIVPCHRVIGSDGALRGFAGGLDTKAYLLEMESRCT